MATRRSTIEVSFVIAITTLIISVLLPNISWSQIERKTAERQRHESDRRSNARGSSFEEKQRIKEMGCRLATKETPECGNSVTDRLTRPSHMEELMKAERERIKRVQVALNASVQAGLDVDGVPGQKTEQAVKRFQAQAGLPIDGFASQGSETESLLMMSGKRLDTLRPGSDYKTLRRSRRELADPAVRFSAKSPASELEKSDPGG